MTKNIKRRVIFLKTFYGLSLICVTCLTTMEKKLY